MNNKKSIIKWFAMLLVMLVAGVSSAVAQSLTLDDFSIKAGETKEVVISLTPAADQTIYGVQTDVKLSDGLTLNVESCVSAHTTIKNLFKNTFTSGVTRFIMVSVDDGTAVATTEETVEVIKLSITAENYFTGGTVTLGNIRLTTSTAGEEKKLDDVVTTVTADVTGEELESVIPETYEYTDDVEMTKTVYKLSRINLIKNGSFEYENRLDGWKTVGYTTDAEASNFTIYETGGIGDGAYITTNGAGVSSEKTLRRSMAVEAGKTYYFMVYTSGKAPDSNNFQYNALFKMTDATTEAGVLKQFEWPQGATATEWSKTEYVFTADESHPFVGVRMGWNSSTNFDNFVLVEATPSGEYDLSATAEDYAALNEAIEAAPTLGFLADEAAPYNNMEAVKALAAAKAIDQTVKNWATTVQEVTDSLKNATWVTNTEEVNAFYDGSFEHDYSGQTGNVQPIGWHGVGNLDNATNVRYMSGSSNAGLTATSNGTALFAKFTALYGTEAGYTLPLKAGVYSLKFLYGGWNEQGTRDIKFYNDENTATVSPAKVTAKDNKAHTTASSWSTYEGIIEVPADGDYIFSLYRQNTTSQNQIAVSDIELYSIPQTPVSMVVTDAKYATFVAPFDVTIPEGVTAYTVDGVGENNELTLTLVTTTIAANTPVVLYSESTVNETVKGVAQSDENPTAGLLTGTYAEIDAQDGWYILQNHEGTVAFYRVDTQSAQPKVPENRAYLTVSGEARAYYLGGGEATVISTLKALTGGDAEIYDVNGHRQAKLQKGVNIIRTKDGQTRKVMVK